MIRLEDSLDYVGAKIYLRLTVSKSISTYLHRPLFSHFGMDLYN